MTSYELLGDRWSRSLAAANATFWRDTRLSDRGFGGQSDAGLLLCGLQRFAEHWNTVHGHRHTLQRDLDLAAANEIYYQHQRGRVFRRAAAALIKCIQCITVERPEKVFAIQGKRENHNANARPNDSSLPESDRRRHDTLQHDMSVLQDHFGAACQTSRH